MASLTLAIALQVAPPVALPPPPAIPVVVWVKNDGDVATAHLVLLNPMQSIVRAVDSSLEARLYFAKQYFAVQLHRVAGDTQVPAAGYATEDYTFKIPAAVNGEAVLSLSGDADGYRFWAARR